MNARGDLRRDGEGAWAQSLALTFRFLFLFVYVLGFVWAVSNFRVVATDSRAVVLRFGSINRESGPGLLLAFPEPIEKVLQLPSADRQNEFPIQTLNASMDMVSVTPRLNAGLFLTGDMNAVQLKATMFYQINDATAYVLSAKHVDPALERLFFASAISVCGGRDLDTILVARPELETAGGASRAGRERLRADLMSEINRRLTDLSNQGASLGISVNRVDLLPSIPGQAAVAFSSVLVAIQDAETRVAEARTNAEKIAQHANQEKDRILTEAQAQAAERLTTAQSRTSAIVALTKGAGAQGLTRRALASQIYTDRIGPLLGKAAQVQTTSGDDAHVILSGASSR
jgi:regulator of protease activity HflC (stomatin/prohibitin superfamily)